MAFGNERLTNCLRVIRNAWHTMRCVLVFKVVCRGFSIALLTP
ncbi:DUF3265 domain-containing protein [Vibrio parahaemolyticus]|nr:DUF3265 domain-containing protein [Vibrio parahaemolyticus]MCR9815309.1 DUF3265 domain-containing protein [Vibrio parahaemolyticus]HBC3568921.1 DUF3265 domain-containing protein [Vibrio parahaemolyticus]